MNTTPTSTAAPAAKAIKRNLPLIEDDDNRLQQSTTRSAERYTFKDGQLAFNRDPEPRMLPGSVRVPCGPLTFDLHGVVGPLLHPRDNGPCNGLCYFDQLVILISFDNPPAQRLLYTWHELGHAANAVYNIGEREQLDEESTCDLIGAFMAGITPEKYAEIVAFITQ